jgi:glycosyltransferase involved in cell wall biosynthesis
MSYNSKPKRIAFVGQTPPPYGGQAIMIEKILHGRYQDVQLLHVRMRFSKDLNENGKLSMFKVFHLLEVIARIYFLRIFKAAHVLYYPPAGPEKVPILRDIVILLATRWLFTTTIFHFHAGGLSEAEPRSIILRSLYRAAYFGADCAVLLSEFNPPDGRKLKARKEVIIPYGIEDHAGSEPILRESFARAHILFVGVVRESKGVMVLVNACSALLAKGLDFQVTIMGKFESVEFEKTVRQIIEENGLGSRINFPGVQTGEAKWQSFRKADIFCFPTFFESETFGVVLLEAMQFCLPVVASAWRGIPSIVTDGKNGFLVGPKDPKSLSDRLEMLILDPALRKKMGQSGRNKFTEEFTLEKFLNRMEHVFKTC